jgi:hypothetical protein
MEFDRETNRFTNNKFANTLLSDTPRERWEQYYAP